MSENNSFSTKITGTSLFNCLIEKCETKSCKITDSKISYGFFVETKVNKCNIESCMLNKCDVYNTHFSEGCDIQNSKVWRSGIENGFLTECELRESYLRKCKINDCEVSGDSIIKQKCKVKDTVLVNCKILDNCKIRKTKAYNCEFDNKCNIFDICFLKNCKITLCKVSEKSNVQNCEIQKSSITGKCYVSDSVLQNDSWANYSKFEYCTTDLTRLYKTKVNQCTLVSGTISMSRVQIAKAINCVVRDCLIINCELSNKCNIVGTVLAKNTVVTDSDNINNCIVYGCDILNSNIHFGILYQTNLKKNFLNQVDLCECKSDSDTITSCVIKDNSKVIGAVMSETDVINSSLSEKCNIITGLIKRSVVKNSSVVICEVRDSNIKICVLTGCKLIDTYLTNSNCIIKSVVTRGLIDKCLVFYSCDFNKVEIFNTGIHSLCTLTDSDIKKCVIETSCILSECDTENTTILGLSSVSRSKLSECKVKLSEIVNCKAKLCLVDKVNIIDCNFVNCNIE